MWPQHFILPTDHLLGVSPSALEQLPQPHRRAELQWVKFYFATLQTYCAVRYGNALALQDIKQHHLLLEGNYVSQQESWNVALTYYHCLDYPSAAGTARSFCFLYCNTHTQKSSHLQQCLPKPSKLLWQDTQPGCWMQVLTAAKQQRAD